jgi:hypothetical protein
MAPLRGENRLSAINRGGVMNSQSSTRSADPRYRSITEKRRSCFLDRRSGEDKRRVYSLDYFSTGGSERRHGRERRAHGERRTRWYKNGVPCVTSR